MPNASKYAVVCSYPGCPITDILNSKDMEVLKPYFQYSGNLFTCASHRSVHPLYLSNKNTIKEIKMGTRVFTNSQKIRLRLKTFWDNHETNYDDDFEEFYSAFTEAVLENLEFLAVTFKI